MFYFYIFLEIESNFHWLQIHHNDNYFGVTINHTDDCRKW